MNMISIKYPIELATEWMTCYAKCLPNLQCIRYGHPKTITLITSKFYSNFILYRIVLCFELLASHEHFAFDFQWMGWAWQGLCRVNENHLTFTSEGDMQAMRQQKATSHELGSIVKFKVMFWVSMLLWSLHFILTCSCQVLVTMLLTLFRPGVIRGPPNVFVHTSKSFWANSLKFGDFPKI